MSTVSRAAESTAPARLLVVGMGELVVSADEGVTLVTYALGSCLGVAVYDPVARVGGMLHAMLPSSEVDPARAAALPALFVDTGVPELFRTCYSRGARKERLLVTIAGASGLSGEDADQFRIGKRNLLMARQLFWKNSVLVHGGEVGGSVSRTLSLNIGDGQVLIRTGSNSRR
jgi:chemotaxis protein CheD